ncbi:E3 SUMO-protein ligase RanBP2-like isoform X2 [Acanthaster planci]|uniref:Nuclear pore complex protein Nup153 n=1 Tax=Acanthaster planci TaxID=133434 RepID=A0A8B7Y6P0_ACAPL|nr:E3 SUMO-protein ligase RanBP2-like isoform X2 [Acanthaster planci]
MLEKFKEAGQLCAQVEGARLFEQEIPWWKKSYQLYQALLPKADEGEQWSPDHIVTFGHLLVSINKLIRITLSVHNTAVNQASRLIKVMDKELFRATDYIESSPSCPEQSGAQTVLREMKAQLYMHLATLLIKMAAMGSAHWADVIGLVTACYLVSAQVPPCSEEAPTAARGDRSSSINSRIHSLAHCRLSEVCHLLTSIVKQQKNDRWLKLCHGKWCSEEGRQQLLSQAFGQGEPDPASSFLLMDDSLVNARFTELPSLIKTVFVYDLESVKAEPDSLQRLVWLGLQWDVRGDGILPDLGQFLQPVFSRLLFSTQRLENTAVDNIRLLDVEAFLYGCVHGAKAQQEQLQARVQPLPKPLPLGLCRGMCSPQQLEWYSALYSMYTAKASPGERAKLRLTIQKGMEVLRCRMNHGMETPLLIRLGRTFMERMREVQQLSEENHNRDQWVGFQQMGVMYWQAAVEHLELLARNRAVPFQQKPFFPYGSRPIPTDKIRQYQDEGTVAIAERKFQQGQFQQAVAMLDKTKSATGSYLKAQMYLTKAQSEAEGQGLELSSSPLSRQGDLLDKAKHALFSTMDAIQDQPENPLHEQIQTSLEEIDRKQATLSHEVAALEEEEAAAAAWDTPLRSLDNSRNISGLSDVTPLESTGKDPSPRRLAAELRSMNLSHSRLMEENAQLRSLAATHSRILEQNQMLIDKQNTLMESNNALMKQVLELNVKFQELSAAQAKRDAAPPPPPPQPQPIPDITSNRPIIISAQECKIDNPSLSTTQLSGATYPVASPVHGLYHHPAYGYYAAAAPQSYGLAAAAAAAAYENPGLHPSLITSTPAMHGAAHAPNLQQYMPYEDATSPTEVETEIMMPSDVVAVGTSAADLQPSTFTRGVADQESSEPNDDMQVTSSGPTSAPDTIPSKQASNKDVASKSPLLVSMLMKQDETSAAVSSTKIGSITAGTPPQSFLSSSSKPSVVAPDNSTVKSEDLGTASAKLGLFHDSQVSQPGAVFGLNQRQASSEHDPTSATTSASAALANFSFKSSQPSPANFTQPKPSPVTPAVAPDKTTSQSPFAGFSFGQLSTGSGTVSSGFTFSNATTSQASTFESVTKPGSQYKENDFGEDDVIFVSEKIPTADQRARAEALFLPPTFFLYEDEPPCPGCPGCDPEDLAARGKSPKSFQPEAAESSQSQAPVFGSTASAQMTFGDMSKMALSGKTKETPITTGMPESSLPSSSVFGAAGGSSSLSFASIRAGKQGTFAGVAGKGFTFAQAGAPVFGAATKEEDGEQESHEHDPHYEPIMSLPELSQVKTGEEEEEVMYKQRARLYRYAKELGVWKERGIGDVKLLRHKHSGVLRLIMRREQVLKLCANHRITTDMKLDPLHSSDRSWVWHAVDYSEDEPCHEQLAIKFKTPEQAHEFKRRLEELQAVRKEEEEREMEQKTEASGPQEEVGETKPEGEEIKKEDSAGASDEPDQEATTEDNFAKFQPKEGDWKCEICWLNNGKDDMACVACMTPKPGAVSSTTAPASGTVNLLGASSSGGNLKFTFGSASGSSFAFGSSQSSDGTAKPSGFKFGGPVAFPSATSLSTPSSSLSTETVKFGATQSDTALTTAEESTQATIAPTTKFTFGSGFQKFDFGGAGDKATQPMTAVKSPSAGFTFGASGLTPPKTDGAGAPATEAAASSEVQGTPVKPSTGFVFGAKSITPPTTKPSEAKPKGYSFADMVKSEGATFSFRLDVSKSLQMSSEKSPVKPKSPGLIKSPGLNKSGDSEYYKDDEGDHIHFEPVVKLPEGFEVKTGEEDETIKFSHRAKLYRFDKASSQWKERGLGDIKLLYNPANQKYRIIMRREQVLKLCANHYVTPELSLQSNAGSTKSWVWMAMDASDEEAQMEQLAVRFKTEEVALQFKNAVDAAKKDIMAEKGGQTDGKKDEKEEGGDEGTDKQDREEVQDDSRGRGDIGEQECEGDRREDTDEKEGDDDHDDDDDDNYTDVDDDDDDDDYEDVDETEEEKGEDQGEHDEEEERQEAEEEGDANHPIVKSCDPNISKAFSELLRTSITSHAKELKLGVETPTTSTSSTSKDEDAVESSKDDSISEERDDIHFEPVAQLPEQVDVITGEEDENELFCSRAKLYRFDKAAAQWKDRGIGDIKILGNTTMKRYRVIMRRDQVLKLCANHYITAEMTLEPNAGSENSLVWQAMDASEGDPQMEELAVRFKLAGTTQRFKTVFEECQAELRKQRQQDDGVSSTSVESQGASVKEQKDESRDDEKASSSPTSETEKPSSESSSTSESSKTESEN